MSWTKIEEVTLSSSQASVTLGNGGTIPQTYKTLVVLVSGRGTTNANYGAGLRATFNGSTSGYSWRLLEGYDSAVSSSTASSQTYLSVGLVPTPLQTGSTFSNIMFAIPNYAGATNKPVSIDYAQDKNAATDWNIGLTAGLWANTAAITSITLALSTGNLDTNSTITLYGLK